MKEREALKLALEAAYLAGFNASGEGYNGEYPFGDKLQDPAENRVWKKNRDNYIEEALAQPEQEPDVGYCKACDNWKCTAKAGCVAISNPPQRTWVGLTDEEISEIACSTQFGISPHDDTLRFAYAITAKLKEKNQ